MRRIRGPRGKLLGLGVLSAVVLLAGFGLAAVFLARGSVQKASLTVAPPTHTTPSRPATTAAFTPPTPPETSVTQVPTTAPLTPPKRHPKPVAHGKPRPVSAGSSQQAASVSNRQLEIERLQRQLHKGAVAFNAPKTLHLDDSAEIALLVGLGNPKEMAAALPGPVSEKHSALVQISDQMQAKLTGIGFKIQPESAETQPVGVVHMTQWRWQVVPTQSGKLHLHLTLNAILQHGDQTEPVTIRTFDRTVPINVTFNERLSSFFSGNWQWLFTTLLLPIGVSVWRVARRRYAGETAPEGPKAPLQP